MSTTHATSITSSWSRRRVIGIHHVQSTSAVNLL